MAVEKITAVPDSSNNLMWRRFSDRFSDRKKIGDVDVPNPDAVSAEAARLRADPNAAQANSDKLNDPVVLEAIANHLRTVLQAAELAQIARKSGFMEDSRWELMRAKNAYKAAVEWALGTGKEQVTDDVDDTFGDFLEQPAPKAKIDKKA